MKEAEGAAAEIETDHGASTVTGWSLIRGEAELPAELGRPGARLEERGVQAEIEGGIVPNAEADQKAGAGGEVQATTKTVSV